MPYTTQGEQIAFFVESVPVPRHLRVEENPRRELLGNSVEIFEGKQLRREKLVRTIEQWIAKLAAQARCVWEAAKQGETLKEIKRFRRNPEVAVPELKRSHYGCIHLIEQWDYLKKVVYSDRFDGEFSLSDKTLMLGLCEVPFGNRSQGFAFLPDMEMSLESCREHVGRFIVDRIGELTELSKAQRAEEERERAMAIDAPELFPDKKLRGWYRELQQVERELFAIYQYVQSVLDPKSVESVEQSDETTAEQVENTASISVVSANVAVSEAPIEPSLPVSTPETVTTIVSKSIETKSALPASPVQKKAVGRAERGRRGSHRSREAARKQALRGLADMVEVNSSHLNTLNIRIGGDAPKVSSPAKMFHTGRTWPPIIADPFSE